MTVVTRGKKARPDFERVQLKNERGEPVFRESTKEGAAQLPVFEKFSLANTEKWTDEYKRPDLDDFADPLEAVQFAQTKLVPLFSDESTGNGHLLACLKAFVKDEVLQDYAKVQLQSEYDRLNAMTEEQRIAEYGAKARKGRPSEHEKLMNEALGSNGKDIMTRLIAAQTASNLAEIQAIFAEMQAAAEARAKGQVITAA